MVNENSGQPLNLLCTDEDKTGAVLWQSKTSLILDFPTDIVASVENRMDKHTEP
jgi:hypothetical protein